MQVKLLFWNTNILNIRLVISPMKPKIILTVTQGQLKGQSIIFEDRTTCIMGRASDCHPKLPDDENHRLVSRYHCLLDINPPQIRIRDFGSLNGTYINNILIGKRPPGTTPEQAHGIPLPEHDLQDGDEIQLGDTLFQVIIETPAQNTEPLSIYASGDRTNIKDRIEQLLSQVVQNGSLFRAIISSNA